MTPEDCALNSAVKAPRNMKTKHVVLLATIVLFGATTWSVAQGTAFTYQGRLSEGTNPANGLYEMDFALHDAVTNGNAVGTSVGIAPVRVTNGLFTVLLDFGSAAFDGSARWLEITVSVYGSDRPAVVLSPRQPLTATPYAIRAGNFSGPVVDGQLSGNIARLDGNQTFMGTVQFANPSNTFSGTFAGNGAAVTNVNLATIESGGAIMSGSSGTFLLSSSLAAGAWPTTVTTADVNADRHPDLISANVNSDTLSVLTNNGRGTFMFFSSLAVGDGPFSVAAVDVNGDRRVDLISANSNTDTLSVLTNDGAGGFTLASSPAVGDYPRSVIAADVNADGHIDLITANRSANTLSVLINNGSGGFTLASSPAVGDTPESVTAADLDRDGSIDLVSANFPNMLSVLLNNGSGGFTLAASPFVGHGCFSVTAADINADGHTDLISANAYEDTLSVLTNNGGGSFTLAFSPAVGDFPNSVRAADLNGDRYPDLVTANSGQQTLSVLTNDGRGRFALASSPSVGTSSSPTDVVAAGVDGDGRMDLMSANSPNGTLSVLLNIGFKFVGNFSGDGRG